MLTLAWATDLYQLDIPVGGMAAGATWQNGSTLYVYLDGDTNTPLVTLVAVRDNETFDDGDTVLGTVSLGNGPSMQRRSCLSVIPQTINGRIGCVDLPRMRRLSLSSSRPATATHTTRSKTTWSLDGKAQTPRPNSRPTTSPRFSCRASRPRTAERTMVLPNRNEGARRSWPESVDD